MVQRVQSVERALELLLAIASSAEPLSAPDLATIAGVNRATTWRLLNTLGHFDLAVRDRATGRYSIGYGALRLAAATGTDAMVRRLRPVLERTAQRVGGSVFLEVASAGELIVLDHVRSDDLVQVDLAGVVVPLHCGSVGKLYLASWTESEIDAFLAESLPAATPHTCTEPAALRAQFDEARRTGIAYNYREHREEWCGITAAIRDRVGRDLAYLNVTLPTFDTTRAQLRALAVPLREAAAEAEALLTRAP